MPHQPAYEYVKDMEKKGGDCYSPICVYDAEYGTYQEPSIAPLAKMAVGTLPEPQKSEATPFKLGK